MWHHVIRHQWPGHCWDPINHQHIESLIASETSSRISLGDRRMQTKDIPWAFRFTVGWSSRILPESARGRVSESSMSTNGANKQQGFPTAQFFRPCCSAVRCCGVYEARASVPRDMSAILWNVVCLTCGRILTAATSSFPKPDSWWSHKAFTGFSQRLARQAQNCWKPVTLSKPSQHGAIMGDWSISLLPMIRKNDALGAVLLLQNLL